MQNEIKKLRDEFNKRLDDLLKQEVKPANSLVPEMGRDYYVIIAVGDCVQQEWSNSINDNKTLAMGNVFLTEQACKDEIAKRKAIQTIKIYIAEHFPFEPDWNNDKIKWHIVYKNNKTLFFVTQTRPSIMNITGRRFGKGVSWRSSVLTVN